MLLRLVLSFALDLPKDDARANGQRDKCAPKSRAEGREARKDHHQCELLHQPQSSGTTCRLCCRTCFMNLGNEDFWPGAASQLNATTLSPQARGLQPTPDPYHSIILPGREVFGFTMEHLSPVCLQSERRWGCHEVDVGVDETVRAGCPSCQTTWCHNPIATCDLM